MSRWIPIIIILFLAATLHFFRLSLLPSGLYWDELDTGYQAYSLLHTGRDYFGTIFSAHLHSFADYRSSLYMLLTVPLVKFFGLTAISIRFVSVVSFLFSVFAMYYLGYRWLKLAKFSWIPPLVFTLAPWGLIQARIAAESGLMLCLFLLGFCCFINFKNFSLSAITWALTLWSYGTAKLFLPLFLLVLIITNPKLINNYKLKIKKFILPFSLFVLVAFIPVYETFTKPVGRRFVETSVFTDPTAKSQVDYQRLDLAMSLGKERTLGMQPSFLEKIVHNRPLFWLNKIVSNYFQSLSSDFLFRIGDPNLRHHLNFINTGQFFVIDLLPFILGICVLLSNLKAISHKLIAIWFLLAPLPSIITSDGGNHAPRLLFLFPAVALIISLGIRKLISNKLLAISYMLIFLMSWSLGVYYFFTQYRTASAYSFNTNFIPAVQMAINSQKNYDYVILDMHNESALMAYLVTSQYSPAVFQTSFPLPSKTLLPGLEGYIFGNIVLLYPGSRDWNSLNLPGNNLVITVISPDSQIVSFQK